MLEQARVGARLALLKQCGQLCKPSACPDGVYLTSNADDFMRWNGVLFVHSGSYIGGVFRFSVQFALENGTLALPSVFFPPILLHPLVEPASGRLNILPYVSLAGDAGWCAMPEEHTFLTSLLYYIHDCFTKSMIDKVVEPWALNENMYSLYHTNAALFERLAQQSVSLSTTQLSLFDTLASSGIPGDVDLVQLTASSQQDTEPPSVAFQFQEISDAHAAQIRDEVLA